MTKATRERVWLLDEARGLAILLMVLYHAGYDLVAIFGVNIPFFFSSWMNLLRDFFAGLFVFISGCACRFSHNNLRRGLLCFGLGMAMTVATAVAMPTQLIRFGILHLLGSSMVLFALLRPLLDKIPLRVGLPAGVLLFLLTFQLPFGHRLGLGPLSLPVPEVFYSTRWLFWLGLPRADFTSADYFSLIPWLFLFLAGSYAGLPLAQHRAPAPFYRLHSRTLSWVGRHTIWVYLLHQPVVYGLLSLIFWILPQNR